MPLLPVQWPLDVRKDITVRDTRLSVVIMADDRTEACGRCSMTSVIDLTNEGVYDEERADRDPFAGERIELTEAELRRASGHVVWLGRLKRRIDEIATSLTYGR
jgi:hypothetical protein